MRVLFCTQAESLRLFEALRRALAPQVERAGFTVADSLVYSRWLAARPDFERSSDLLLKEWEVTGAPYAAPDLAKLAGHERRLGAEAGLFGSLIADRRLFMGKDCTYSQDYRRRFSDAQLLCILERGIERMEKLFDELRPDAVVGFICVTMLDYLAYLVARSRGIAVLNLRPTRVGDRVTAGSTLNDPSPELAARYAQLCAGAQSDHLAEARAYIARVREQHGRYEGVVSPSSKPALRLNTARRSPLARMSATLDNYSAYRRIAANDNHVPHPLRALLFAGLVNPWRARRARAHLQAGYVTNDQLRSMRYLFYPLHTEPEVSLLVYGRPYVNQIEVIRWLAMSLPADMMLVVKEHPWMVGKRTMGAYRKILNIPRVRFADPARDARGLIQGAAMVGVITGSVALEAAMLGKPVLTFGDCPYNLLPPTMVRRIADPRELPQLIRATLDSRPGDDTALERYVAAVMDTSVSLNLYSVLLGKKNVYVERASEYEQEIGKLANYLRPLLPPAARPAQQPGAVGAALW